MAEKVVQKQEQFIKQIDEIIDKNRLSHAYFIETNGYPDYMDAVLAFLKRIFKGNTTDRNYKLINKEFEYPEIKLLKADGKIIKKEQILELKRECLETPILGKYMVYVIDGAEFLNPSSANTLLKFLEEPEDNIIGILISNNQYQVINTLISRCQILSLIPEETEYKNETEASSFVEAIKKGDYSLFLDNREKYAWEKDRLIMFLDQVILYCLTNTYDIMNVSIATLVEERKQQLKFNVNTKLFIDDLVLELIEVVKCTN